MSCEHILPSDMGYGTGVDPGEGFDSHDEARYNLEQQIDNEEMEFEVDREDYCDEFEPDVDESQEWDDYYGGDNGDHGMYYDSYDGE